MLYETQHNILQPNPHFSDIKALGAKKTPDLLYSQLEIYSTCRWTAGLSTFFSYHLEIEEVHRN